MGCKLLALPESRESTWGWQTKLQGLTGNFSCEDFSRLVQVRFAQNGPWLHIPQGVRLASSQFWGVSKEEQVSASAKLPKRALLTATVCLPQ